MLSGRFVAARFWLGYLPDFAAKRLYIIPRASALGMGVVRSALKVPTDRVWLEPGLLIKSGARTPVPAWATRYDRSCFGRHFQGVSSYAIDPGLKPWAVMYRRFAAKATNPAGAKEAHDPSP